MNEGDAFQRASDDFVEQARNIRSDQWSSSTPCTEWDVRALVNHIAGEWLWVGELMQGKTIDEVGERLNGDILGDDPLAKLSEAHRTATAAFNAPRAMEKTVHLSSGDTNGQDYAQQMVSDSVIHTWDLARGIGGDETLDPQLVDFACDYFQKHAEEWRSGGAFAAKKEATDDSKQAQLIAITGR
ncbi:MAG: TIGR03086 family metal-binding protein [Candidatus Dormibacteria bacterium]